MPLHPLHPLHRARILHLSLLAACAMVGCAPTLDWREVRPAGSQLLLLFPCKPSSQQRRVPLAGPPAMLTLHACSAGGQTWGLAVADVADPARVASALAALSASAMANIGAAPSKAANFTVRGATPSPASQRQLLQGKLPDGVRVTLHTAVFAHGTLVYQVSVLGEQETAEAADTFLEAVRVQP